MDQKRERVIDTLCQCVYANGLPATREEFAPIADKVLEELAKTHTMIPNRLVKDAYLAGKEIGPGGRQAYARGQVASELAYYWKPEGKGGV